jgi:hypothetical protein
MARSFGSSHIPESMRLQEYCKRDKSDWFPQGFNQRKKHPSEQSYVLSYLSGLAKDHKSRLGSCIIDVSRANATRRGPRGRSFDSARVIGIRCEALVHEFFS